MPIQANLDVGAPGAPLPLEGDDESKSAGLVSAATVAFTQAPVITGIEKGIAALSGGPMVSQADAQAKMKAQGYDGSSIPATGVTSGALDVMMQRQSDLKVNENIAQRANLSGTSRFVASIAGGLPDPSNVALMAFAPQLKLPEAAAEAGLAARAGAVALRGAAGAAEGGAYGAAFTYGSQALGHGLGDADASSQDNLRAVLFGGVLGGGLHVGFGGKTPVVKTVPGLPDLRDQIFSQVAKAEDATGTGVLSRDTGGLTKFGISEKAHPGVDIANLTQEGAAKILKSDYWDKIGGDHLPPAVQHTAMDAAVNQGVENANKWLAESDGDPVKFNQLRADHYNMLAKENPEKYGKYLNGWLHRLENVANEPILAQGSAPRIVSTDQMGRNVDQLPPQTRSDALQAAVTQFMHDDNVNVDQVINKSLEEHYGVAPTTDFDPTGGADTGPRNALTIADEHDAQVQSITNEAYGRADPRRLAGDDTDLSKAIPEQGGALVTQFDKDRIEAVRTASAEAPKVEAKTSEGPLTAEAKSSTADVLKEAEAHRINVGGEPRKVGIKELGFEKNDEGALEGNLKTAGETLKAHADAALDAGYKVTLHTEGKEIPIVGKGMRDANGNPWGAASILQSSKDGKPDLSAHLAIEEPEQSEFDKQMAEHDEAITAHNQYADSVEAAVRCAANMGVE